MCKLIWVFAGLTCEDIILQYDSNDFSRYFIYLTTEFTLIVIFKGVDSVKIDFASFWKGVYSKREEFVPFSK